MSAPDTGPEPRAAEASLERSLSLPLLIFYGVGTILGLGIYVLLGEVAQHAGMLTPFAFLGAALLAVCTALSYGELSARIPLSAGEVNYVDEAFHARILSMAVGWLIVLSAIVSTATVVNGYVGYVHVYAEGLPDWLVISVIVIVLGGVAAWGITQSAALITTITCIEIAGILLVIFIGGGALSELPARWDELVPSFAFADLGRVFFGAFLAFFTFIGFQDMVNVAEEAKDPRRDMPRAIAVSMAVLTLLYLVVATVAVLGLSPDELARSDAPLADVLARHGEGYPEIISAIGLVAIINGVLVQIVMMARVLYGMANKRMAPRLFARVHPRTRTPLWSTGLSTIVILALALSFELGELAVATNYILILVFVAVNAALIRLKQRDLRPEGISRIPAAVPWLGALLSAAVLVTQAVSSLVGA